jgi:hypothetical protein
MTQFPFVISERFNELAIGYYSVDLIPVCAKGYYAAVL